MTVTGITSPKLPPELPPELASARNFDRFPGERRSIAAFESPAMRDTTGTGDGTYTFSGRAVVYDVWTKLYEGEYLGERIRILERIAPGALTPALAGDPDVHLTHGHDMRTSMARLQVVGPYGDVRRGGMKIWEDDFGVNVFARLNPSLSHVRDLKAQMDDGIIDQMSFAFRISDETCETQHETDSGTTITTYAYTIERISDLFDVSVCAQGAYPTTYAQMRNVAETALARHPVFSGGATRHGGPMPVGGSTVTQGAGGRITALRARARIARLSYERKLYGS